MLLRSLVLSVLALTLSACNLSGTTAKGPFKSGSSVSFSRINTQANPITSRTVSSQTNSNKGKYLLTNIRWSGWGQLQVTGQYFNEFTANTSTDSITLNAITRKDKFNDTANVHIFSHLAAARIKQRVANGQNRLSAWRDTQSDMKQLFGLSKVSRNIHRGVEQLSLVRGTGRYHENNANLLLFTGSFLAVDGSEAALELLTTDFADDAQFNGVGSALFNAIATMGATDGLLTSLSNNLINFGINNPPNNGDMPQLPIWVNQDTVDNVAPVVAVTGTNPMTIVVGTPYVDEGATATDDVDGEVSATAIDGSDVIDTSTIGTHTVTYNATDVAGNVGEATRIVNVVEASDTEAPVITLTGGNSQTIEVATGEVIPPYQDPGYTVTDNRDESVDVAVNGTVDTSVVGTYERIYSATDVAGNHVSVTRTVIVEDTIAPILTLNGSANLIVQKGANYNDEGATAIDGYEGDISSAVSVDNPVDTNIPATYTVTYNVVDSAGNAPSQITRTVRVNAPPTANAGTNVSVLIGNSVDLLGTGADTDGTVTYQWKRGSDVLATTAAYSYTPSASETLTFVVTDNDGAVTTDSVSIEVTLPATYQIVFAVDTITVPRNLDATLFTQGLQVMTSVKDGNGNTVVGAVPTFDASSVDLSTPGSYSVVFSYTDPYGRTVTKTLTVIVENYAPLATSASITVDEDTTNNPITLVAHDSNQGDTLTYTVTQPANGTVSGTAPNVTYTPNPNYAGSDSFTFTVSDGLAESTGTINITVTDIAEPNHPPVATNQNITVDQDSAAVAITLAATDVDAADTLVFSTTNLPSHGTLAGTAPNVTYTPNAGYTGSDSFEFSVSDGTDTVTGTINITVVADTTLPVISLLGDSPIDVVEGTNYIDAGATANDNKDGNITTKIVVDNPVDTSVIATYTVTYDVADNTGNDAIQVTRTVNVISHQNHVPEGTLQATIVVDEDSANNPITISGTDVDGGTLTYEDVSGSTTNGSLTLVNDGTGQHYLYTPNPDYFGPDSFSFTLSDGTHTSVPVTVSISVTPDGNHTPVADSQATITVTQNSANNVIPTLTATDLDGDILTFKDISGATTNGSLDLVNDGTGQNYLYTPNSGFIGSDSFTFTVDDGDDISDPVTINIEVVAPVASACTATLASEAGFNDTFITFEKPDTPWPGDLLFNALTVNDIAGVFNAARSQGDHNHNGKVLVMPTQDVWDGYTDSQKALYLINSERCIRGIRPYEGISPTVVTDTAQYYADFLASNSMFAHDADGRSPFERLSQLSGVNVNTLQNGGNADFFTRGENLAYTAISASGATPPTIYEPVVKAVYAWMYRDKQATKKIDPVTGAVSYSYGHREFILARGLVENSGEPNKEGLIGVATSTVEEALNGGGSTTKVYTVMNGFDPHEGWSMNDVQTVDLMESNNCLDGFIGETDNNGKLLCVPQGLVMQ